MGAYARMLLDELSGDYEGGARIDTRGGYDIYCVTGSGSQDGTTTFDGFIIRGIYGER